MVHTASLRSTKPVTVLGTVMGIVREGNWFTHQVEATRPDGHRFTLQVVSKQRQTGSVAVRWDPNGFAEPRFASTKPWGLYAVLTTVLAVVAVILWAMVA